MQYRNMDHQEASTFYRLPMITDENVAKLFDLLINDGFKVEAFQKHVEKRGINTEKRVIILLMTFANGVIANAIKILESYENQLKQLGEEEITFDKIASLVFLRGVPVV